MLDSLTHGRFAEQLGSQFRLLAPPADAVELVLVTVTPLRSNSRPGDNAPRREPFSLVFRAPKDCRLPQKIYHMEHPRLGDHDIFLVPIGPDAEGMRFEAVFN